MAEPPRGTNRTLYGDVNPLAEMAFEDKVTLLAEIDAYARASDPRVRQVTASLSGNWQALYDETRAMREACGPAHMKAILATGELQTLRNVARASLVTMMAGSDFIKTSTGKEPVNATLPVSLVMMRAIREYQDRTGVRVRS